MWCASFSERCLSIVVIRRSSTSEGYLLSLHISAGIHRGHSH
nr:MAG TPA: hypothetical protein [Caudoviricetes sp.]